jgi:orotidine-5'-phosphate decarboxylase
MPSIAPSGWHGLAEQGRELGFGERLLAVFASSGHLCVGIDPHPYLLAQWGLPDSGAGLREFGLRVVEAASGRVGIVKPQNAFFERHGSAGYAALEDTLEAARAAGLLIISDVKRGDLGTSVEAYAQAWLAPGSPLEADAMTISAYQGVGSISAPMSFAQANGKGLFVLAATSNPEATATQTAIVSGGEFGSRTVAASIVAEVNVSNSNLGSTGTLGSFGVVIGATISLSDYGLTDAELRSTPILAPGFGHQGALFSEIGPRFGAAAGNVVASSSRAILEAGPGAIADAISAQARELTESFPA